MTGCLRELRGGEFIFRQGDVEEHLYIVIEGAVVLTRQTEAGNTNLDDLKPGDVFGELALIDPRPRSANAMAAQDGTKVMAVDRAGFMFLVSQQPGFALAVMETLARWLHRGEPPTPRPSAITPPAAGEAFVSDEVHDGVFHFRSRTRSSNVYLFKGPKRNVLIDAGLCSSFGDLCRCLGSAGLRQEDINMIVLTHEHFDHVGAAPFFNGKPIIAAHRLAASKITNRDDFAIMSGSFNEEAKSFSVDIMLDDGTMIDNGRHRLRVFHTPGHTSGCISLFDAGSGILVSGDMAFAGGPIGGVFGSGNLSDTLYSLEVMGELNARILLPGHGKISHDPIGDIRQTVVRTTALLRDSKMIFEKLDRQDTVTKLIMSVRGLTR